MALHGPVCLILDNECGIPALVPVKVHRRLSPGPRRRPGNARPEALLTGPRLRQRPVDSEMLDRLRALTVGEDQDGLTEGGCNVPVEQPVQILRKGRRRLHRIIQAQTDEPAEQQVVVQLLHQLPLTSDRVQRLEQEGTQQLLWQDRGPTEVHIHRALSTARGAAVRATDGRPGVSIRGPRES